MGWYGMYMGSFEHCSPTAIILLCHPYIGLCVCSVRMSNESFKSTSRLLLKLSKMFAHFQLEMKSYEQQ